jgi:thiosulfate/3-mercaptopyruvate sulfurtransferase
LQKLVKNDDVVLVSTRTTSDYKKVHITGAVHINHTDLYKDGPVKNMLKSPAEIATILVSEWHWSNPKKSCFMMMAQANMPAGCIGLLSYLGAKDVKILDGHMDAWKAAANR